MLPVITPELSPGKVSNRHISQQVNKPFFIVGDDPLSHQWLKLRLNHLKSIKAVGIVVNVKTDTGFYRMQSYGLPMYPVRGKDFASAFKLTHYPVLITQGEIKQ
ncbi:hypothetical protein MACH09_45630 [Vibrio sp. MACH09]|nr:hypothetical protein MACH09_45630 [Vibrio sp. MACH09]